MNRRSLLAVGLAAAGLVAVVAGIYQELLHIDPSYTGTITTGWGNELNHEEVLLARLSALGVAGAVASTRWKSAAVVPAAMGGVVLFYALRAVLHYALDPGLYTEVAVYGGPTRYVLGAEPFLLVAGGSLLVAAGFLGWTAHATGGDDVDLSSESSSAT